MASFPQTTSSGVTQRLRSGKRFDPTPGKVRYSSRWMGAGAGASALATLALSRGGIPALLALGGVGAIGAIYALLVEPRMPRLEQITLHFPKLPPALDGLRIGQLSDMHLGHRYSAENTRWAVERLMAERPDLLALTGDFVSYDRNIGDLPALLRPLQAPLGIYAVPGNHDHWEGVGAIKEILTPLGVEFLINRSRRLTWNGAEFMIAGVDDIWDGEADLDAALCDTADSPFTLLLCHAPDMADDAADRGVHLQLSGHTHGGHLRLPGLGAFALPRHGWRYSIGHAHAGKAQVYVNRGIGGLPMRLLCRPEATLITLRRG